MTEIEKRMDRFDAVVTEYLRSRNKTVEYLSEQIGCAPSTLWRYRHRATYFEKMPYMVFTIVMRNSNVSNEDLRYILGLPTGKASDWR